jgi:hypothetical protein
MASGVMNNGKREACLSSSALAFLILMGCQGVPLKECDSLCQKDQISGQVR